MQVKPISSVNPHDLLADEQPTTRSSVYQTITANLFERVGIEFATESSEGVFEVDGELVGCFLVKLDDFEYCFREISRLPTKRRLNFGNVNRT